MKVLGGQGANVQPSPTIRHSGSQFFIYPRVDIRISQRAVPRSDPSIAFVDHEEHFYLYLETPDVAAAADDLRRHGVQPIHDVHETPSGTRECVIKDNAGHTLYLGQRL
jgi:hypothetical protein